MRKKEENEEKKKKIQSISTSIHTKMVNVYTIFALISIITKKKT